MYLDEKPIAQLERHIFIRIFLFALQLFLPKMCFFLTFEKSRQTEYCFYCGCVSQHYVHLFMEHCCIFGYLNLESLGASGQSILYTFTLHACSLFLHLKKKVFFYHNLLFSVFCCDLVKENQTHYL